MSIGPTAQDLEREQPPDLRCDETKFWHAQIDKREETIRTQSAELAALRAQVAERDAAWWCWLNERGLIRGADSVLQYMAVVHQVDAALAPPQPVAKETKP